MHYKRGIKKERERFVLTSETPVGQGVSTSVNIVATRPLTVYNLIHRNTQGLYLISLRVIPSADISNYFYFKKQVNGLVVRAAEVNIRRKEQVSTW